MCFSHVYLSHMFSPIISRLGYELLHALQEIAISKTIFYKHSIL
jgi:hypothetical protein